MSDDDPTGRTRREGRGGEDMKRIFTQCGSCGALESWAEAPESDGARCGWCPSHRWPLRWLVPVEDIPAFTRSDVATRNRRWLMPQAAGVTRG